MCGFSGALLADEANRSWVSDVVERMGQRVAHRGPDSAGLWSDSRLTFAHRRLSVVDVTDTGSQPMHSASGRYVLVFNGEIYNFVELRKALPPGIRFRGHSDSEVLLEGIEHWGVEETLRRVDGMFAFGLWDRFEQELTLARDPFGEKPLFVLHQTGAMWFSSELSSFEEVPGSRELDADAVEDFFTLGYIGRDRTIYRDARQLAPGTVEVYRASDDPEVTAFWTPTAGPPALDYSPPPDVVANIRDLLDQSIRRRLVADRPVGAFLSGGIDSSITCALAASHVSGALDTFTMCWEQQEYDESRQAAAVAKSIGTRHHEIRLGQADVVDATRRLGGLIDQPFADQSQLGVMLLSEGARRSVVVALSGDGGDELFGGYNRHLWLLRTARLRHAAGARTRGLLAGGIKHAAPQLERLLSPVPKSRRPRLMRDKLNKLGDAFAATSGVNAYEATLAHVSQSGRAWPLPTEVAWALESKDVNKQLWGLRVADMVGYLPDCVLTKVDRATMSVALESRTPFLTKELAGLALSLPAATLIESGKGKAPLRHLLRQLLPEIDFSAPKSGFAVPVGDLLRGALRKDAEDAVASHSQRPLGVGTRAVTALTRVKAGDDSAADLLWATLMFEQWANHHGQ